MLGSLGRAAQRAARSELRIALLHKATAAAVNEAIFTTGLQGGLIRGRNAAALASGYSRIGFHTVVPSFAAQAQEASNEGTEQVPAGTRGIQDGEVAENPEKKREGGYLMSYPTYEKEYLESVKPKHKPPEKLYQKTALWAVTAMRWGFDTITGYPKNMDEKKWLQRMVFLETVAGVPGMVGGMLRHLRSLRTMSRDHGWIHTLLEEAENERMHLLTFLELKKPGPLFRGFVLLTQGVFFNLYTLFYIVSPKHCHAFVGYLEEEAVRTYTHALQEIDSGVLKAWQTQKPPQIGATYWGLGDSGTMRDLILAVRADEYGHSHVNHTFSVLKPEEDNPFEKGAHQVP